MKFLKRTIIYQIMIKGKFFCSICSIFLFLNASCLDVVEDSKQKKKIEQEKNPNIIIFYVDDLGYGDLGCYGAQNVETPNVDLLAKGGIRHTDSHSSSATCTPSRYALLTGEYAFRNQAAVLPGDAPLIIDTNKMTLPKMLQHNGYRTAVVGKWHLGLGDGNLDWNKDISPGPKEVGFDYSFLIPSTGDRVPTVYVENNSIVGASKEDKPLIVSYANKVGDVQTGTDNPERLRQAADPQHSGTIINGVSRIGYMDGAESAWWKDEDFPDILTQKAIDFMKTSDGEPFFLFFSFHDIHVPRVPNNRFLGKSKMGLRGDAIVQMDWMTGQVMKALEATGKLENTLVIFTSDNGPVLNDGYEDGAAEELGSHKPSGGYRGGKYSVYEAGTRVPTITYWKNKIRPDTTAALWSQVDLIVSLAKITDSKLPIEIAKDGFDVSNVIMNANAKGRDILVEESYTLSLRENFMKYIAPMAKSKPLPNWIEGKGIDGGHMYEPQLFDLKNDPWEKHNLAEKFPERVAQMQRALDSIKLL
ncbi:arylsulfatase [Croceitalea marina]|uniref:Arylsulfatase n=1 Tax=Croceitalea marina TaxID=1775166 RepID=A0ABW5MX63_9FLAO